MGGEVSLHLLGTGDAFGSGGRHNTCFLLSAPEGRYLIDCGASALIAMKAAGVEPGVLDAVLLSHLHGDHFGGLPSLLLDARFRVRRERPLAVAGPPGVEERVRAAREVLYPGSSEGELGFELSFVELAAKQPAEVAGATVTPWPAVHPSGTPSYALRVECGGRTIAYSGDTEWTDALPEVARGADLFVCEAYVYDKQVPYHLSYATLLERRAELDCRRLILTHASDDLLERAGELEIELAHDGLVVEL